jgi:Domain of unknown function (DUF1707)
MTGPQGPAAAGGDRLRAGHADREQVIETLKDAFVHGRLTKDELDTRVSQALASRTYAELAALTADIPAGLTAAKPPTPARVQGGQAVLRPGPVIKAATGLYAGVWVYAVFFPKGADGPSMFVALTFLGGFVYLIILAICMGQMAALRRERRSGGQSPRRPAAGADGQAPRRLPSADPGGELPPADGGQQHMADTERSRLLGQQSSGSRPGRPRSSECGARTPRTTRPVPGTPQQVTFAL